MADPVSPSPAPALRASVLLLTNDTDLAAARTSRHLALALNRLGFRALVRDTRLIRWGALEAGLEEPARREAFDVAAVAKWAKLVEDYGIELVLSLDLHWLVSKHLFANDPRVHQVHSFWRSDVPDPLPGAPTFALDARELAGAAKVVHHCASEGQVEALRRCGVEQVRRYVPGAPAEYLRAATSCEARDRVGFVGDPTERTAALVGRLAKRGWLDVHGSPEAWKPHGVVARPLPSFPQLPALYRRYPALLNLGDDGQLFEVAACGRLSVSLERPGLRDWYGDGEIVIVADEAALASAAENILRDPDAALVAGERARTRTAREHLWDHRVAAMLGVS